jgi:hypothetical protein
VEDGQHERGGLAAPGHGAGEDVPAFEGGGDRFGLNRCWSEEPELFQSFLEIGMELDRRKRQGVALIEWWFGGILKVPHQRLRIADFAAGVRSPKSAALRGKLAYHRISL